MVQLRPQFSHIDALHEQDKSVWRQERALEERTINRLDENEPRAVNMAVKSTENNDELDMYGAMSETAKLLKAMRDEPWQRMSWVDQDVRRAHAGVEHLTDLNRRMNHIKSTTRIWSTKIQKTLPS